MGARCEIGDANPVEAGERAAHRVIERGDPLSGDAFGAGKNAGDGASCGAIGVGVPTAGNGENDGLGEVSGAPQHPGGNQGSVGNGVDPVVMTKLFADDLPSGLPRASAIVHGKNSSQRFVQAGGRWYVSQRFDDRRSCVIGGERRGRQGSAPHFAVDTVGSMGQDRVLVYKSRCRAGITGIDVAVHISSDLGTNPFAVGVVHLSHGRDVQLVNQVAVGGAFSRVGLCVGQPIQPLASHIGGCVATAMGSRTCSASMA